MLAQKENEILRLRSAAEFYAKNLLRGKREGEIRIMQELAKDRGDMARAALGWESERE